MDAWILDESPGAYRWGAIDPPPLGTDDVRIRVEAAEPRRVSRVVASRPRRDDERPVGEEPTEGD